MLKYVYMKDFVELDKSVTSDFPSADEVHSKVIKGNTYTKCTAIHILYNTYTQAKSWVTAFLSLNKLDRVPKEKHNSIHTLSCVSRTSTIRKYGNIMQFSGQGINATYMNEINLFPSNTQV